MIATRVEPIYVVGDLNVRLDRAVDPNAIRLTEIISSYGLDNRVTMPTHQSGGLLDVVITRSDLPSLDVQVVDVGLSDHHMLQWRVSTARSPPVVETTVRRPWRSLDVDDFRSALSTSVLCQPDHWRGLDADELSTLYESELTAILDSLIPARVMNRRPRPSDPWFDADCRAAKRTTHRLERVAIAAAKKSNANAAALAADA